MQNINLHKAGLTFGALIGSWHLLWALMVTLGFAQPIINFVLWMHFIKPLYVISPFNIGTAIALVAITSLVGYAMGLIFAIIWNLLHR
jgi:hypothetical protein